MGRRRVTTAVVLALMAAGCSGGDETDESGGSGDSEPPPEETAVAPSAGCDGDSTDEVDLAETTLGVRDEDRRFLLTAPAWRAGDGPRPLVVDFHGLAEGAEVHAEMTQLGPLGLEEGFVTVFPHGRGEPVQWDVATDPEANDDLAYLEAVLDDVAEKQCIDTRRVYATGLSNGAMMASTAACALSDRIAAIAPVAGVTFPEGCAPSRPVPALAIHGTADPILRFNGGVGTGALDSALGGGDAASTTTTTVPADLDGPGYPEAVRNWAEANGCAAAPVDEAVGDEVIRRTFDCSADATVEFLIVEGGGHSWPSSAFSQSIESIVGHTTTDIDGSREVWTFLRQHRLPAG